MLELLSDLGTVPVVTEYEGPCFQHVNPAGQNGSGVIYCDNPDNFIPGVLSTKEIKGKEFRAYFAYGKVGGIYRKSRLDGSSTPGMGVCNSQEWGYVEYPKELKMVPELSSVIREMTIKAANRLELSYGAVDFIFSEDGYVYILETNSAPTLIDGELLDFFARSIKDAVYADAVD
jgi:hypothetical protein